MDLDLTDEQEALRQAAEDLFAKKAPIAAVRAAEPLGFDECVEFAVPLCFLALLAPLFRDAPSVLAALTAGVAVLALAHLPMRLNLIAAGLLGIAVGTLADVARERWKAR